MRAAAVAVLIAFALPGCVAPEEIPNAGAETDETIVVAVVDSGVNPYHDAFHAPDRADAVGVAEALGLHATSLLLSAAKDYSAAVAEDSQLWASVRPGELYAFAETPVLAISFREPDDEPAILDRTNHGTSTSSRVIAQAPSAVVVLVVVDSGYCVNEFRTDCALSESIASGLAWAAQQPWIDVISVSIGARGNMADTHATFPEAEEVVQASRAADASGKLVVFSAGNEPAPSYTDAYSGPPWVISVGGAQDGGRSHAALASTFPDVVANFTECVPTALSRSGCTFAAGTSLAAPTVAGILAQTLGQLRSGGPSDALDFTNHDVRAALNLSARMPRPGQWEPFEPEPDPVSTLGNVTIPVVVPTAQFGWGYVDATSGSEIVRRIKSRDFSASAEQAERAAEIAAFHAIREQYWRT